MPRRYLVEHRYFDTDSIDIRVEQGYEIGRPSLLYLRAEGEEDEIAVSVSGKVQMVVGESFFELGARYSQAVAFPL